MKDLFYIENLPNGKRIARELNQYNVMVKTDFAVIDKKGKKIIRQMDEATFKLKFG